MLFCLETIRRHITRPFFVESKFIYIYISFTSLIIPLRPPEEMVTRGNVTKRAQIKIVVVVVVVVVVAVLEIV